jgi:hypothetical protein
MNHMEADMMPEPLKARKAEIIADAIASVLLIAVAIGVFSKMIPPAISHSDVG